MMMHNYLKDFFTSRRSEVLEVTKVDYTFERRMELNYKEGKDEGEEIGQKKLVKAVELLREGVDKEDILKQGIDIKTIELAEGIR